MAMVTDGTGDNRLLLRLILSKCAVFCCAWVGLSAFETTRWRGLKRKTECLQRSAYKPSFYIF